jgi:hypothetical protein
MTDLYPFELTADELKIHLDEAVESTIADLTSQFMFIPRGKSFLSYEEFNAGYEALRVETSNFTALGVDRLWNALKSNARSLLVLRAIIGVSPPEWVDIAKEELQDYEDLLSDVDQGSARDVEYSVKNDSVFFTSRSGSGEKTVSRVTSLLHAAKIVLSRGPEQTEAHLINRLDKFDTRGGLDTIHHAAMHDVPYSVLLYERYLGRPYASRRDSVSSLVGDVMESAIEAHLNDAKIPVRKTKRAERIPGFQQAPDFIIPNELDPAVIIEAKITGDDGTARDKVARVLRLAQMREERRSQGLRPYQVIACVDGRGFGVRRRDMKDLLIACEGKVFTLATLPRLIENTALVAFKPRNPPGLVQ